MHACKQWLKEKGRDTKDRLKSLPGVRDWSCLQPVKDEGPLTLIKIPLGLPCVQSMNLTVATLQVGERHHDRECSGFGGVSPRSCSLHAILPSIKSTSAVRILFIGWENLFFTNRKPASNRTGTSQLPRKKQTEVAQLVFASHHHHHN